MITAIIVNYHAADLTIRAARSILCENPGEKVDIWVVDNSENYKEALILREKLNNTCRILINSKNIGFGPACNRVFECTASKWIFLLNPDAYLLPGALTRLLAFMKNKPDVGATGPIVYWDTEKFFLLPPSTYPAPWLDLITLPYGPITSKFAWLRSLWWRRYAIQVWQATSPQVQKNLSGGHVLLRRSAVEKAGGLFDQRFFLYYEDTDLFIRLRHAGFKLFMVPEASVIHEFSGCKREKWQWKLRKMEESLSFYLKKHHSRNPAFFLNKWLRSRSAICPKIQLPNIRNMGVLKKPPIFQLPKGSQTHWLLEWSPTPYMYPSAGHFGSGEKAYFPKSAWSILPPGKQYVRLGSSKDFWISPTIWQWEKA